MKRVLWILLPVIAVSFALPVLAGGEKCQGSTQECLDKMASHADQKGWIGIELDWNEEANNGTITGVIADSPAEKAGFKEGDVYFAIEGVTFDTEDKEVWAKVKKNMVPGNTVEVTLIRDGKKKDFAVTLAPMPEDVMAMQIGHHMMSHASAEGTNAEEE